ncbi:raffinose/stachyose/melibiose transport system permease protein [Kribbella sp. VKM Ac-2527]|uniref:Raffinose/stachyose/melibiose transport system permease protein n=1 Tax=Kribbella caucasensis TaxID=2512215 RepID=A0A4R6JFR6_9ACTN|nr:sugar ABC transporter permease [Kribbella sp. VKM Ac-2527]TDO34814.1 raffinose/stachyose/melibiose transport system permease protein [Kribbella sp. VKM Ac-2527]
MTNSGILLDAPARDESPTPVPPRRRRSGVNRTHPALFLFPLPALVLYVVFFAMPTFEGVRYSVTDWDGFSAEYNNVGAGNFSTIATADDLFRGALFNNLKFMLVVVVFQTLISLALAVFLVRNSRSSILLRALYFLPTILSSVSVAFIWKFVYDPNFGLINTALGAVGLDGLKSSFLGDDGKAIFFVAATQVWFHVGQMMVIYVAGLQQIPADLYESADVDGASRWRQFRHITWPLVAPASAIVIAYTTVQSFKAFDLILGMGGNPPKPSLDILSTRIYAGFANSQFGYAAAESIVFMVVIALVTWLQRRAVALAQSQA